MMGERIKAQMKANGLKVKDLSERSGVPQSTIYGILRRNSTSVQRETGIKLAKALGCSTSELYGFEPHKTTLSRWHVLQLKEAIQAIEKEIDNLMKICDMGEEI
jgi:transcriptional regulator with XRE-family HTH domain